MMGLPCGSCPYLNLMVIFPASQRIIFHIYIYEKLIYAWTHLFVCAVYGKICKAMNAVV